LHRNAALSPRGRYLLCQRIEAGWSITAAAEAQQVSRQCAAKWWRRFQQEGLLGLEDHSSRPSSCPHQTPPAVERRILRARRKLRRGPDELGFQLGIPASTVHAVLRRHGVSRLKHLDRPTGRVVRRIETTRPGELVQVDVKKLARIPDGGGHRAWGRTGTKNGSMSKRGRGYAHVHSAIDAYSRLAYSEFAGPEGVLLPALLLKEQRRSADPFHLEVNRDLNAVGDPDEGNAAVHAEFLYQLTRILGEVRWNPCCTWKDLSKNACLAAVHRSL